MRLAVLVSLVITLSATTAFAEEAAPPAKSMHVGGYGGPLLITTSIARDPAVLAGARGALLLERQLSIGGGGFGLVNPIEAPSAARGQDPRIGFGAGGLWAQWVWVPDWLAQPTTGVMFGAGTLSHQTHAYSSEYVSTPFFFVMPEVGVEVQLAEFVRVGADLNYRFVSGVDLPGFTSSDASGAGGALHAKIGVF